MDNAVDSEVTINLSLFKRFRLYHFFNTKSPTVFNYNVYRLRVFIFIIITQCVTYYSLLGLINTSPEKNNDSIDNDVDVFQSVYAQFHSMFCCFKMFVFLYYADDVWNLLEIARIDFLKSVSCLKHIQILQDYRERSFKIVNFFSIFLWTILFFFMLIPLFTNILFVNASATQRYESIYNIRFPVSTSNFNRYFFVFYGMETSIAVLQVMTISLTDILLISFAYIIIAYYKIHAQAFGDVGKKLKTQNDADGMHKKNQFYNIYCCLELVSCLCQFSINKLN